MANLRRHLPFNLSKPPPAPPIGQPTGRSLFYTSPLDAHHYGNNAVNSNCRNNGTPQTTPSSSNVAPPSPATVLVKQLQEALTLCNAYTQELTVLCNAGVRTARCLSSVLKEVPATDAGSSSQLPNAKASPQQIAGQFLEAWNQLTLATGGAVTAVQQGALAALQDITSRLEANQKVASGANPLTDDSSKILVGCLMTVIQLQYQFSLSICESLVDLAVPLPEDGMPSSHARSGGFDDNGARGNSPDFLHACVDSLTGIQRNFSVCMSKVSQKVDVPAATTATTIALPTHTPLYMSLSNPGVALRTGQRRVSEVIARQTGDADTDSSIRRRWSIAGVNRGCSVAADEQLLKQWAAPPTADSHSLWYPNVSLRTAHDTWNDNAEDHFKQIKDGKHHRRSVFASNEELQDVISLLSCQPSNPSSPTSESSVNSHPITDGAGGGDGQSFLWPATGSLTNVMLSNFGQDKDEGPNLPQMETSPQLTAWPETTDVNYVWGVPTKKPPKPAAVPSFDFSDPPLGYPLDNVSQTAPSMHPSLAAFRDGTSNCGLNPLSSNDGQIQHARATKSTSWPVMETQSKNVPSNNMDANNSSDQEDTFNGNGCHEKEAAFFMGLDLVGNDLMASVRQRRHSSGGTFTENGHIEYPSPSIRTKSIDDISLDEKCSKTSTWPLKQSSPKSTYSSMYVGNNVQKMTSEDQVSQVWSLASDFPHGLPPSGLENRCKPKMERKYSLFGHAP